MQVASDGSGIGLLGNVSFIIHWQLKQSIKPSILIWIIILELMSSINYLATVSIVAAIAK
jgi:hypothetical protein